MKLSWRMQVLLAWRDAVIEKRYFSVWPVRSKREPDHTPGKMREILEDVPF